MSRFVEPALDAADLSAEAHVRLALAERAEDPARKRQYVMEASSLYYRMSLRKQWFGSDGRPEAGIHLPSEKHVSDEKFIGALKDKLAKADQDIVTSWSNKIRQVDETDFGHYEKCSKDDKISSLLMMISILLTIVSVAFIALREMRHES